MHLVDTSTNLTDQSETVLHDASGSATSLKIAHPVIKPSGHPRPHQETVSLIELIRFIYLLIFIKDGT